MATLTQSLAVIQARAGSSRLPGKVLRPFGHGRSILEHVLQATSQVLPKANIVLATTALPNDDAVAKIGELVGVAVHRGSVDDVLGRFVGACDGRPEDVVVRICADNPFLQPSFLSTLITSFRTEDDYLSFAFPKGQPVILSHIGMFAEAISVDLLRQLDQVARTPRHREHLTTMVLDAPDFCSRRFLAVPEPLADRTDIRLTVDTALDFDVLSALHAKAETLGVLSNPAELVSLIDSDDALRAAMIHAITLNAK